MNKLTKEQIEEIIKSDYEGKPYALLFAVILGVGILIVAGVFVMVVLVNVIFA